MLLTNSLWTAVAVWISGARARIGYARDGRRWLLTSALRPEREGPFFRPVPHIDYLLAIAAHMGCPATDRRMQLSVTDRGRELGERLFQRIGWSGSAPMAVINSAAATRPERIWSEDRVGQLAVSLADQRGYHVLLHCGPADRDYADRIVARLRHPRISSMGVAEDLPIALTKAVLSRARVVISTDSGPRHIAVALNRPVVSLFGATDPEWTRTYNVPEQILVPEVGRGGEETRPLPEGMQGIRVDQVLAAVDRAVAPVAAA